MRHTRPVRPLSIPLGVAAVALVAATLPVSGAHAAQEPAFSGYAADAWAAPVKIEVYESTIPIPATPQAELEIAYTTTEATTGLHKGRASFLWPGDPVGSGFVTFGEKLGLPEQVYENGYPAQVNSEHPGGPESQTDEPFPGTMMRTRASAEEVAALAGFSSDGRPPADREQGDEAPVAPAPPGGPAALTGAAPAEEEPDSSSPLPPELAALVDVGSFTSRSASAPGADRVTSTAYSALEDASLLGGVVVFEAISARTTTTSDGARSDVTGGSRAGSITIAGQTFAMGSDGIRAGGQDLDVPGLPDEPDQALAQLGLTVTLPQRDLATRGLEASGLVEAVQVEIDTVRLKQHIDQVPLGDVVGALPPNELTKVVSTLANLAPRIVITLGNAAARTETITGLDSPLVDAPVVPAVPEDPGATGGSSGTGATGGTAGSSGTGTPGTSGTPASAAPAASGAPSAGAGLEDAALAAGLPALTTVPGALTMGGILLAIGAGTWLRRIGALALGGASSCAHGLDSGLPDLRKA